MNKSLLEPAKKLEMRLLELPSLVDAFSHFRFEAVTRWSQWLKETETIFLHYGFVESADLAGIRAALLVNEFDPSMTRALRNKTQLARSLASVQQVQLIITSKYKLLNEKLEQVRMLIKQILIPAQAAGMIHEVNGTGFNTYLEGLLHQFQRHDQLGPSINNAIAMVGKFDVLRILAEEIEFTDMEQPR